MKTTGADTGRRETIESEVMLNWLCHAAWSAVEPCVKFEKKKRSEKHAVMPYFHCMVRLDLTQLTFGTRYTSLFLNIFPLSHLIAIATPCECAVSSLTQHSLNLFIGN